jgi:hypothetical protein
MGPATATNASTNANTNAPPTAELRKAPDGAIEIWLAGQQLGGIEPEPAGLRIVLGDADPGGGLTLAWAGDPISLRIDLAAGLP